MTINPPPGGEPGSADAAQCCNRGPQASYSDGHFVHRLLRLFHGHAGNAGGTLAIGGEGLTVSELSVQTGEVKINGSIEYVQYTAKREKQESLFKRLVR